MSTVRLRNISPIGWLAVPELGREGEAPGYVCHEPAACHANHEHTELAEAPDQGAGPLAPGEEFECPRETAESLLEQSENFAPVKKTTTKKEG